MSGLLLVLIRLNGVNCFEKAFLQNNKNTG